MLSEFEPNGRKHGQLETNTLVLRVEVALEEACRVAADTVALEVKKVVAGVAGMADIVVAFMEMEADLVDRRAISKTPEAAE
jgi:hypothetical protein